MRTRLDSVIARLQAQRECLNWAAQEIDGRDGIILELGLGNGRTYDHLRHLFPNRDIFVFERSVGAHPDCIPPDSRLYEGDFRETLPKAAADLGGSAVLVHGDVGSANAERDRALAESLAGLLPPLLAPGALVIGDRHFPIEGAREVALPGGIEKNRYFIKAV